MPVETRKQVQTPINFRCRKTRNSTKTASLPSEGKILSDAHRKPKDVDEDDALVSVLMTPEINLSSRSSRRKESRLCRSVPAKCIRTSSSSGQMASSSSPRKRTLLKEMSTNDQHPVTPPCSPRKMKKENIPVQEEMAVDESSKLSPSSKARLTSAAALKMLSIPHLGHDRASPRKPAWASPEKMIKSPQKSSRENAVKASLSFSPSKRSPSTPHLNHVRASPRKPAWVTPEKTLKSPQKSSRENVARVSLSLSPTKRSPIKAVASLKLQKAEGERYKNTKQALHTALPDRLLCRDKELNTITSFLTTHLTKEKAGSLYISGAPGTGKTACLSQVLKRQQKLTSKAEVVVFNCMSVRQSHGIYGKILDEVTAGHQGKLSAKEASRKLQKTFTSSGPMVVLVLDEIDHLDSKGQEVLYTMFEWPSLPRSRLILIGIANALDLTDRILPRLQARPKCRPALLHFCPYSKDQIATILLDRVQTGCADDDVVEPIAMQLCARKVAAVAGDIRKALDVCRRAVEIVECEVKSQLLFNGRSSVKSPGVASNQPAMKKVGIKQVSSVIAEVYGSRLATSSNQSQTFPLQQKLMICTVLLMVRGGRVKEITLGKCHETYTKLCRDRQMSAVEQSEFLSLCQFVESRGLIGMKMSKETRQSKLSLKLNEKEVEMALQDKVLLSSILQSGISKKK